MAKYYFSKLFWHTRSEIFETLPESADVFISDSLEELNYIKGLALVEGFSIVTYLVNLSDLSTFNSIISKYRKRLVNPYICTTKESLLTALNKEEIKDRRVGLGLRIEII